MLHTRQLSFAYSPTRTLTFPDLDCAKGTQCLVLGQSGVGKTTLLHLLAGLRMPSTGSVALNGIECTALPPAARDKFRGRNIGLVFQQPHFVRALSLTENLLWAQQLAGYTPDKTRIAALLQRLDIGELAHQQPHRLSQGEQQRASIARALINRPSLILADEPTAALDDANAAQVIHLLQAEASAARAILLVVTHDQRLKNRITNHIQL